MHRRSAEVRSRYDFGRLLFLFEHQREERHIARRRSFDDELRGAAEAMRLKTA